MAMAKLPVWRPVTTGYSDAWSAIRMMPMTAGYTLLIMFASNVVEYVVPTGLAGNLILGAILSFGVSAVQNFFLTAVMIAVHRYIILGEAATRYALVPGDPVFRAFFGWLMALSILGILIFVLFTPNDQPAVVSLGVVLIALVVMIVVTTRLSILFPAIAVQAPGATAANAWADSKRHTFGIFLIFLLAVLPIMIGAVVFIIPFAVNEATPGATLGLPEMIVMSVVQTFFVILCVAIASRLYEALADRLLRSTSSIAPRM